jgi:hypothetical protein
VLPVPIGQANDVVRPASGRPVRMNSGKK